MKKLLKALIIPLALAIGIAPIAFGMVKTKSAKASSLSSLYLLSPTLVAQGQSQTFVFDSATSEIKVIENGQIVLNQSLAETPLDITYANNHLFVLFASSVSAYAFTPADGETPAQLTEQEIQSYIGDDLSGEEFTCTGQNAALSLVQEAENSISLFLQSQTGANIEIHKYDLTYYSIEHLYGAEYHSVVYISTQLESSTTDAASRLTKIAAQKTADGYNFLATDGQNTYGIVQSANPLTCTIIESAASVSVCTYNGGFAYATQSNVQTTNVNFVKDSPLTYAAQDLSANEDTLVAISAAGPKVEVLLPTENSGKSIFSNNYTEPVINHTEHKFGTTLVPLELLEFPYSVSGTSVPNNQDVIILASNSSEFEGLSFVTFVSGGANQYGYLPTEQIQIKAESATTYSAVTTTNTNLYTIASNVADQTNRVLTDLPKGSKITILHDCANITNNGETYVYAQSETGWLGYVEKAKTSRSVTNPTVRKTKTNATIKSDTQLFDTRSTEYPLFAIQKGSRIKISGLLNPTTKYTCIQIEDEQGTIHTGYVLTKTIAPDNLTTLQVTGIVLLAVNVLLLIIITAFYISNKRQLRQKAIYEQKQ